MRVRIVVMASGEGTNLQALLDAERAGVLGGSIVAVLSDRAGAGALRRAREAGKPAVLLQPVPAGGPGGGPGGAASCGCGANGGGQDDGGDDGDAGHDRVDGDAGDGHETAGGAGRLPGGRPASRPGRDAWDRAILAELARWRPDLVVLAGFMRILGPEVVAAYPHRIMNVHPSLLPAFPGRHAVRRALEHGVKVTGCTVHFVDEGVDTGPIILQAPVPVGETDDEATLTRRIQAEEHRIYPVAVWLFCSGRLEVEGRRVRVRGPVPARLEPGGDSRRGHGDQPHL